MLSSVGRATANLHPQLQRDTNIDKLKALKPLKPRETAVERFKSTRRDQEQKKEDYFFYNILDYNKEAEAKLRQVSYVPIVSPVLTVLDRGAPCRQVQTQI